MFGRHFREIRASCVAYAKTSHLHAQQVAQAHLSHIVADVLVVLEVAVAMGSLAADAGRTSGDEHVGLRYVSIKAKPKDEVGVRRTIFTPARLEFTTPASFQACGPQAPCPHVE
jgi:hypothetical protein